MSRQKVRHRYHLAALAAPLVMLCALLPYVSTSAAGVTSTSPMAKIGRTVLMPDHQAVIKPGQVPSLGPVFVIVGENKSLYEINSKDAPYIVNTMEPKSAWFTNYNDVAKGSLADYVGLTSGQFAPCQTNGPCGQFDVPSIFSQLGKGNWMDWNESMPSNCYPKDSGSYSDLNAYQAGHNPGLYYTGLPCSTYDVPAGTTGPDDMSALNAALAAGTVPKYNFITPNDCEDGHNDCNGAHTYAYAVSEYDNFLQREIPLIEQSPAFGSNGVIFATFDEGVESTDDTNTMMAVLGPRVQPGIYSDYYNHYSTLATIEAGLGLPCLANACNVTTLPVFGKSGSLPSVSITQPSSGSSVSGTADVAGTAVAQGSAKISQVQVSIDNGTPQTASGTTSWSDNIDTTALANGPHTVTVTATDSDGNAGTASETVTVDNPASCPAPSADQTELSGNVSGESNQDGWTGTYNAQSVVARVEPPGGSYAGLWALRVTPRSGDFGAAGVANADPVWVTYTDAGTAYEASVFLSASIPGERLVVQLTEETSSGAVVRKASTTVTLNDTDWHQLTVTDTAKDNHDVLDYYVYAQNLKTGSHGFLADCLSLWSASTD